MDVFSIFSGTTDSHSLSLRLRTASKHFEAVKQRYGRHNALSTSDIPWNECSKEERLSILVHYHEQDHVVVLLSSPFGLLLWRCDQVLRIGASYFISKIVQAGIKEISLPLTKWYRHDGGRDRMEEAISQGRLPWELPVKYYELEVPMRTLNKLDSVCEELDTVRKLKDILFGPSPELRFNNMTIGEFLQTANRAYRYLSSRSDLNLVVQWTTSLEHSSKLFEYGIFGPINGRHIIEAMGRIREVDMLKELGAPATEIEAWEKTAISNVYKPVYEGLRKIGLESIPARNLCASALNGRIDPACVDRAEPSVQVEETLPWFRLNRLAKAYQESGLDPSELEYVQAGRELSEIAGLGSNLAAPFSSALENGLIGPEANWTPVRSGNVPNLTDFGVPLQTFLSYSELPIEETLKAFRDKFQEQDHLLRTHLFSHTPITNPMTRYEDGFHFRPIPSVDGLARQIMSMWRRMVDEQFVAGLVYGRPVENPESIGKSVWEGYKTYVGSHGATVDERKRDQFLQMFTKERLKVYPHEEVSINSLMFYEPRDSSG
jgi:hypothetical protein